MTRTDIRPCQLGLTHRTADTPTGLNVTCPQCEAAPREIVQHEDSGGTRWWSLARLCTACLENA